MGSENAVQVEETVTKLSKDYYWYSPVLDKQLEHKRADYVIMPNTYETLKAALQLAVDEKVPVTPRGAGTGNYGQGVP